MHQASTKWGLLDRMWRSINRIVLTFWCLAVSFLCNIHVTYLIQWIYWHLWGDKNRWNLCNMCMWIWVWYVKICASGWNIFEHVSYHTSPNTSHSISWCQHPPVHSRRYLSSEIYISKGKSKVHQPTATNSDWRENSQYQRLVLLGYVLLYTRHHIILCQFADNNNFDPMFKKVQWATILKTIFHIQTTDFYFSLCIISWWIE